MRCARPWLLLTLALALPAAVAAAPPPEGRCPARNAAPGAEPEVDSGGFLVQEGASVSLEQLLQLHSLLPPEIWSHRDVFFYEGMRMEIGWCHRRYGAAPFYADATRSFAGQARLDEAGNLLGYTAGLPFPPESIDPSAPDAALRWAWNFEMRYRGAGPIGKFKLVDLPDRVGAPETYLGEFFLVKTGHRADLAASDYRLPESTKTTWVAGGKFLEPFGARGLAWRQIRPRGAEADWSKPDDTFVYIPELRKTRRAASAWVDGIYTPRYRVAGQNDGGLVPFATNEGGEYAPGFQMLPTGAGKSIGATEDIRRGFMGLAIRPNAYVWSLVGEREVLAPLNGNAPGWPTSPDRNYGPWGLAVASDRWDVRWAVVLRGRARKEIEGVAGVTLWIDWQTQQPLYFVTQKKNGALVDVGILVHRYSGDAARYPAWPSSEPANVFDPVAAAFYYVPGRGSGWRRESYDVRSLPLEPDEIRKLTSTDDLLKGH
jgi:Protein of unknown function (DUF1329)